MHFRLSNMKSPSPVATHLCLLSGVDCTYSSTDAASFFQNAWLQHFQLGEILKAYCHHQEAALHLRHVLELKPGYAPALRALADMEAIPDSSVHAYTVIIIVLLVLGVLFWILSTLEAGDAASSSAGSNEDDGSGQQQQHRRNKHNNHRRLQQM